MNNAIRSFAQSLRGRSQKKSPTAGGTGAVSREKKVSQTPTPSPLVPQAPSASPKKLPVISPVSTPPPVAKFNPDSSGIDRNEAFRRIVKFERSNDESLKETARIMRIFYAFQNIE